MGLTIVLACVSIAAAGGVSALDAVQGVGAAEAVDVFTWERIAAEESCLVVIYNQVHNFSSAVRSEQKGGRTFFEWHPGGESVVTRWCGRDASDAFAAAGPPHHLGVASEKGYGGLVVGVLDATSHRVRRAAPAVEEGASVDDGGWREAIGRQSWFHYHSVAARYPESPTADDEKAMRGLVESLRLYPCEVCRNALLGGELDEVGPIRTATRSAVVLWWCGLHNVVNRDIGKPPYACDVATLDAAYVAECSACIPEAAAPAFAEL